MKKQEIRQKIIENYISSYNKFDIVGMCENLSKNVVFKNFSNGELNMSIKGIKNFKEQATATKEYFSSRNQLIKNWSFEDKKVNIAIDYKGIIAIDLPNGMKKGDILTLTGESEFEFDSHDKIVSLIDKS